MDIISLILSPPFLANRIYLISVIISAIILVVFSNFINQHIVFPVADYFREKTAQKLSVRRGWIRRYLSEAVAAILFIIYCFFGSYFLTEYFISPVLGRFKNVILIVVLIIFFLTSYAINNPKSRKAFFGF